MVRSSLPWFVGTLEVLGPAMPFFAPVFGLLTKAYAAACAMADASEAARQLGERLRELGTTLANTCSNTSAAPAAIVAGSEEYYQVPYIARIRALVEDAVALLTKHKKGGKLRKFLLSSEHKIALQDINDRLTQCIADAALFLAVENQRDMLVVRREVQVNTSDIASLSARFEDLVLQFKGGWGSLMDILRQGQPGIVRSAIEQKVVSLDVYVPLRYGLCSPPLSSGDTQLDLDPLMQALMFGTAEQIGQLVPGGGSQKSGGIRTLLLQGTAGTGKSLFGWHMMQTWAQLPPEQQRSARMPIVITLPGCKEAVQRDANTQSSRTDDFILQQLLAAYHNPGLEALLASELREQVRLVYKERFVFVLDGVDELVAKEHINRLYSLAVWENSVFVVSSRTGFFEDDDQALNHCAPLLDTDRSRLNRAAMRCLHLLPFTTQQTHVYVRQFAQSYADLFVGWDEQRYLATLAGFPQLSEFLTEPLMLFLLLNVLPDLASAQAPRLNSFFLQILDKTDRTRVLPKVRRAELYSLFVHQWARREAGRMKKLDADGNVDTGFVKAVVKFCQDMAFEMFLNHRTQVVISSAASAQPAQTAAQQQQQYDMDECDGDQEATNAAAAQNRTDSFLTALLGKEGAELSLRCSPLKRSGNTYSFLHKTVQEYFVAMAVSRDLTARKFKAEAAKAFETLLLAPHGDLSSLLIGRQLLTAGNMPNILRFCADMVDGRAQMYISLGPVVNREQRCFEAQRGVSESDAHGLDILQPSARALWDIVQASRLPSSRTHGSVAIAAANSMMVLNASGMIFDGCELSYATLGPPDGLAVPGSMQCVHVSSNGLSATDHSSTVPPSRPVFMDVSGGVFSGARLDHACLQQARIDGCSFANASLAGANLTGVSCGLLPMLEHNNEVLSVCMSADGKHIVSGSRDDIVRVWSMDSGTLLHTLEGHTSWVTSVCMSPDGKHIVSGSNDKTVRVWSMDSGTLLHTLKGHTEWVTSVCMSPDGRHIVSGSEDETVRVWSMDSGTLLHTLDLRTGWVLSVCMSPDGKHIVFGSSGGTVRVCSLDSGTLLHTLEGHTYEVTSVCMSPNGKHIVSGSLDKTVRVWSTDSGTLLRILEGRTGDVYSVCMSPDGKHIVSGSDDKTVRVWSMDSGTLLHTLEGHAQCVNSVCMSPDGKHIVSGSIDGTVRVWSMDSGNLMRTVEGHTNGVNFVLMSPDGKHIVSMSDDKTVRVWTLDSGTLLHTLEGHTDAVTFMCISPDGNHIVSSSNDKTARVWSLYLGTLRHTLEGHTEKVSSLCTSPDCKHIVSCSRDKTVRVWSMDSGSLLHTLEGHTGEVSFVCTSPDGKHIASGSYDKTARVWSMDSGTLLHILEGHTDGVHSVCMSPDGKHIVSGSWDKTVRVWSMDSGTLLHTLEGHTSWVDRVSMSPDGKHIVSCSAQAEDNNVRVWSLDMGTLLLTLEGHTFCSGTSPDGKLKASYRDNAVAVYDNVAMQQDTALSVAVTGPIFLLCRPTSPRRLLRLLGNQASLTFANCCCSGAVLDSKTAMLLAQLGGVMQ